MCIAEAGERAVLWDSPSRRKTKSDRTVFGRRAVQTGLVPGEDNGESRGRANDVITQMQNKA